MWIDDSTGFGGGGVDGGGVDGGDFEQSGECLAVRAADNAHVLLDTILLGDGDGDALAGLASVRSYKRLTGTLLGRHCSSWEAGEILCCECFS